MKTNLLHINKLLFSTILSALVFITGCKEEEKPEPFITLSRTEAETEYHGLTESRENVNFEIGANTPWEVTYTDDWILPNHKNGERGRTRIFLSIDENTTGKDREGYVVFEANGMKQTFVVYQKLKVDDLSVSPSKITVVKSGLLAEGDKASIYISTNSDWTITVQENCDWLRPEIISGKAGNTTVYLNIEKNETGEIRNGNFTINAGSLESSVSVTQNLEGLKVSPTIISVNKYGYEDESQTPLSVTVTAAESWTVTSDAWIRLSQTSGTSGETKLTISVENNNTGIIRNGQISFSSVNGLTASIAVTQNNKENLFEDDGKPVGHNYYSEPFDWGKVFGKDDQVGTNGSKTSTLPIHGSSEDNQAAFKAFSTAGLKDYNPDGACIYIAQHYLKMGRTNFQTGIILPGLTSIPKGKCSDISLTFDACPNVGGSGIADEVSIIVEIISGPGTIERDGNKLSDPMIPEGRYVWTPMQVNILGITAETQIAVRSYQQKVSGYYRWFLDNLVMTKIAAQ